MNTPARALTARFFATPAEYLALRRQWSALMNATPRPALTAAHHLLYTILLGHDWRKGFTPITNRRKLANGAFYDWGMFPAIRALHSSAAEERLLAPFAGLVTPAMLAEARQLVPMLSPYNCDPQDFTSGAFPVPAYILPETAAAPLSVKEPTHA